VGAGGWYAHQAGYFEPQLDALLTATATRGDLAIMVTERGELESSQSLQVNCEIEGGGKLVTISPEGTRVKKGDEVARFDTDALSKAINIQEVKLGQAVGKIKTAQSELEVQKNKAESEIAKAELALTLAKIDHESYEKGEYSVELNKREGAWNTAKKDLKEAEDLLAFNRSLVKKGLAQPQQLRALELRVEAMRLIVNQQERDVELLKKYTYKRKITEFEAKAKDTERELVRTKKSQEAATGKATNELQAAEKTAAIELQELNRLKAQLDKCIVKAPGDGIVIFTNQRFFDPNSRVRPGATLFFQQPIFTLPDLDRMQVKLKIHESVVKKVQKDMPATMQVDALPNQVLHGKVLSVASVAQDDWRGSGVKEYQTEVSIDDLPLDAGLRPGMTAEVKILIKTIPDALTVPVQSVTESDSQHVCYVVSGNTVERRVVEIGDSNEQLTEVKSGIREGEMVALDARLRAAGELKKGDLKNGDGKKPGQVPPAEQPDTGKAAVAAIAK
jgi:HlyD family secretion protein